MEMASEMAEEMVVQGHDTEPLPTGLWLREMMALADDCASVPSMTEDQAIRRAYYLSCLCPHPLQSLLRPKIPESEIEAFLDRGDIEKAAALILGDGEIAIIPLGEGGPGYKARYRIGDGIHATLDAQMVGLAMIGAWARFFSELRRP